jgi:probable HAF family extracellular repeat protein
MSSRTLWIATLCCAAGLTLAPLGACAQNFLTDLGTGSASGLNNSGQVVLSNGIWSNGTVTAFPTGFLGKAINAQGDVAGVTAAGHAALDIAGAVTDLGTLRGQQIFGVAAINASDQFVGSALQFGLCCVAYMYSGGVITPINFPQPHPGATGSLASGINDGGEVTGCTTGSPAQEAAIFVNGTFIDLGPGCANAINASGQVTGYQLSASLNASHAFIYANGTMTVLTEPPPANNSEAVAINSGGQTVGSLSDPQTDEGAFFFNGVMSNVNLLISAADPLKSVTISQAVAINDNRLLLLSGYSGVGPPTPTCCRRLGSTLRPGR